MVGLSGAAIKQRSIDIYGITGEFTVLKDGDESPITVKYFQTVASNRSNDSSGNALDLLAELKPMRERVKSEDLKDLRSLLQRDLSDYRVANDLVPYLQGKGSIVGFFPSILVALMPNGFLSEAADAADYPLPKDISDKSTQKREYGEYWNIENYRIDGKFVSLARLSVNPVDTDFIVLDGQHRANAFRYLAGAFDDATDDTSIYSVFYQECGGPAPEQFDAELPVTIVWFEGDEGVPSSLISRKLFVDVNTTAKKVSKSRNILLNDTELASICVTSFYSKLAEKGYELDTLSLMHGGFDCDGKFPSDFPKMTIFSPQTIHYMLSYFLLSRPNHTELGNTIGSDSYGNFGNYHERLKDLCDGLSDDLISQVIKGNNDSLLVIDGIFRKSLICKFQKIIDEFKFLESHFTGCVSINENINTSAAAERIGAWTKVFKGGEGLYNAFNHASQERENLTGRLHTYKAAVDQINEEFISLRNLNLENYDNAFQTFTSQAGLTGFFMALEFTFEQDGWSNELITKFLLAINSYSAEQWTIILTEYKRGVQKESSPKLWPTMREIFLRFIEVKEESWVFFNSSSLQDFHPDFIFCRNNLISLLNSYKRNSPEEKPEVEEQEKWIDSSIEKLVICLKRVNVISYTESSIRQKLSDFTKTKVESLYPSIE